MTRQSALSGSLSTAEGETLIYIPRKSRSYKGLVFCLESISTHTHTSFLPTKKCLQRLLLFVDIVAGIGAQGPCPPTHVPSSRQDRQDYTMTLAFVLSLRKTRLFHCESFSCIASASGWPFTFGGQRFLVFLSICGVEALPNYSLANSYSKLFKQTPWAKGSGTSCLAFPVTLFCG